MDMMTPYIATTSQKMMDIRFLVLIRGALTPPPRIEEPVMKIPLFEILSVFARVRVWYSCAYHAAPTTDRPMQRPMPRSAHACGDTLSRNRPTCRSALLEIVLSRDRRRC